MNLLADIGGTNTRLCLGDARGPVPGSLCSYRNDEVGDFAAALSDFRVQTGNARVAAACLAVAGPVADTRARLKNRNWTFEATELAGATGAAQVVLLNDLAALGYALPHLQAEQVQLLRPARGGAWSGNGQRFVLGLGTGVNLSVSRETAPEVFTVLEAEAGHVALPAPVSHVLEQAVGSRTRDFATLEDVFAGKGLSALHTARTGEDPVRADLLLDRKTGRETARLAASLLGLTLRELILSYMPLSGVFLAGSAARGLMDAAPGAMLEALEGAQILPDIVSAPPISVITDDAAALAGCAARLAQETPLAKG